MTMFDSHTPPRADRALAAEDVPPPVAKWAMPLGVTLLAYGVLGSVLMVLAAAATMAGPWLMKLAVPAGEPPRMPPVLLVFTMISCAVGLGMGIYLITASASIMGQRQRGVERARRWATVRIVVAMAALVLSWLILPTQVEYNRLVHGWQIAAANDARVREAMGEFDPAANRKQAMLFQLGGTLAVCLMPIATIFVLSRPRVAARVALWDH